MTGNTKQPQTNPQSTAPKRPELQPPDHERSTNIEQRVGARGLQGSMDSAEFYRSITGTQVIADAIEKRGRQLEAQEDMAANLAAQKQMKLWALFAAFMFAMAKSEKMDDWREAWREEVERQAHQGEAASKNSSDDPQKATIINAATMDMLNEAMRNAWNNAEKAKKRFHKLENHLKEAEKFNDKVATMEKPEAIAALQEKIDTLEKGVEADTKEINKWRKAGNHEKAMEKMEELNGKNIQLRSLKDNLAVTKGEKQYYDREGNSVSSSKSADFVVSSDKKLVKEGNELYLLPKNETLTDANREAARNDFKSNQSDISSARTILSSSRSIEVRALDAEVSQIKQQIQEQQAPNQSLAEGPAPRASAMRPLPDSPDADKGLQNRQSPSKS